MMPELPSLVACSGFGVGVGIHRAFIEMRMNVRTKAFVFMTKIVSKDLRYATGLGVGHGWRVKRRRHGRGAGVGRGLGVAVGRGVGPMVESVHAPRPKVPATSTSSAAS